MRNQLKNKNFIIKNTKIKNLYVLISKKNSDKRGFLQRIFCNRDLKKILKHRKIVQVNITLTKKSGYIRGLHFQKSYSKEMKFVTCINGKVCDFALDIRKNSKTFLKYHAEILSKNNKKIMLIPEGFAHGFQTLSKNCELLYFHTQFYSKKNEDGVRIDDPRLNISLPKKISGMSKRDSSFVLKKNFKGLNV